MIQLKRLFDRLIRHGTLFGLALATLTPAVQAQVAFTTPVNVSNSPATQDGQTMLVDSTGNIDIVWYGPLFSRSTDGGVTFSAPVDVSNGTGEGAPWFFPSIAVDPAGNIYIAWEGCGGPCGSTGIFLSRSTDAGATFSAPLQISPAGVEPRIVVDSSGRIDIAWVTWTGRTLISPGGPDSPPVYAYDFTAYFSQSVDGGNTFSTPTSVFTSQENSAGQNPTMQLEADATGSIYILGEGAAGEFVLLARSNNGGASFAITYLDNVPHCNPSSAKMVLDATGNINVVWPPRSNGQCHVVYSRSVDGGSSFSIPKDLTPSSPVATYPKIAVDSASGIYVAWFELEQNFNPQGTIFFSRSTDGGTTFSMPQALSTDPSGFNQFSDAQWGALLVDSHGNVDVSWEDKKPAGDWEILFTRSTDSGATFTAATSVSGPGASGSFSLAPAIAEDVNSNLFLAWVHTDQWPGPFHVFFARNVELSSATVSPADVTGGSSSTGTVALNGPAPTGGATVSLSSSDPSVSVAATVTIPEGTTSTTFTVATSPVAVRTAAVITAAFGGVTQTATITVEPPVLTSLALNPSNVIGGVQASTGTVTLSGPAPNGGAVVILSSSNSSAASVPSSVTVPAGATSATFTVSTSVVVVSTSVTISGFFNNTTQSANLSLLL